MGTDNIHHKRKKERERVKTKDRKLGKVRWLIVCEGKKTEPNYFIGLDNFLKEKLEKDYKLIIEVSGEGMNTLSLVDKAIKIRKQNNINYAEIFVIFDKDSFLDDTFNNAINKCNANKFIPIWSNESFELWYLLHFIYNESKNTRQEYCEKLTSHLGENYQKNDKQMFETLLPKIKIAYKNSKKLDNLAKKEYSCAKKNPCTQMHLIFDELETELAYNGIKFWDAIKDSI